MSEAKAFFQRCPDQVGKVLLLEARPGEARRRFLAEVCAAAREAGARASLLDCDFAAGGPWAGVRELFASLLDELQAERPDLVHRHDYELVHVVPALRRMLAVRNPTLTDLAPPEEKSRNYPADRAFRIVHGLVDLLAEWGPTAGIWLIAADGFDLGGHIGRRFFRELMRRRGAALRIVFVAACAPGGSGELAAELAPAVRGWTESLDLAVEPPPAPPDREAAARRAEELERVVGLDRLEIPVHLEELIHAWRTAGRPDRAFRYQYQALDMYNNLGLYEDAIVYGEAVRRLYPEHGGGDGELHWMIFVKLFMSYVGIREAEAAYRVAEEEVIGRETDPDRLSWLCYLLAMLHARYFRGRDLAKAEELLDRGLEHLGAAGLPEEKLAFQSVFNRNGLALVRHFQGRHREAIELCRSGWERLDRSLTPDRHRLHRSVLLYNMAQVFLATREHDEAIAHYTAAMEMDPNYSEYYNERGNALMKVNRLGEAAADYRTAIELSPPYFEVWTNLGQCHRLMGQHREAIAAYTRSLDLEPGQVLAWLGRAQSGEAVGEAEQAMADYSAALAIDPDLWEALASRAVLHYERGDLASSLGDVGRAIELAPGVADLYQNRAIVLADLGERQAAAADLERYLQLNPDADDRSLIEERLRALAA